MVSQNFTRVICHDLYVLGATSCIYILIGLPANFILIWTIFKNKTLRKPINFLIASFAAINIFGILIQFPVYSVNAFNCKFIFDHSVCILTGISFFFSAIANNNILAMICIERYLVICKPSIQRKYLAKNRILIGLLVSMFFALFWSLTPLFGWNEFIYGGIGISCTFNAGPATLNLLSHLISFIIFCYIIPIIIYTYTGIAIVKTVRESSIRFRTNLPAQKKLKKESRLVKITVMLITAFLVSYSPSMIMVLISLIQEIELATIHPMLLEISLLLAKSSLVWPALLYMFMNKDIKANLFHSHKVNEATIQK